MAAESALPRLDGLPVLPPRPSTREPRVGRTDYAERLTKKIARGGDRPDKSASDAPRPAAAAETGRPLSSPEVRPARQPDPEATTNNSEVAPTLSASETPDPVESGDAALEGAVSVEGATEPVAAVPTLLDEFVWNSDETAIEAAPHSEAIPPWSSVSGSDQHAKAVMPAPSPESPIEAPAAMTALLLGPDTAAEASTDSAPATKPVSTPVAAPKGFAAVVTPAGNGEAPQSPESKKSQDAVAATPGVSLDSEEITFEVKADSVGPESHDQELPEPVAKESSSTDSAEPPREVSEQPAPLSPVVATSLDDAEAAMSSDAMKTGDAGSTIGTAGIPAQASSVAAASPLAEETAEPEAPRSTSEPDSTSRPAKHAAKKSEAAEKADQAQSTVSALAAAEPAGIASPEAAALSVEPTEDAAAGIAARDEGEPRPVAPVGRGSEPARADRAEARVSRSHDADADDLVRHAASALRASDGLDRPIRIRLTPPELGALRVEVSRQDGRVSAQFEVTTTAAQTALNDQLASLRESLGRAGVPVDRIEVRLAEPSREDGRSDDRREGQGQSRDERGQGERRRDDRRNPAGREGADGSDDSERRITAPEAPSRRDPSHVGGDAVDIQV